MPRVGEQWSTGDQVYEILEDTGDGWRVDIHVGTAENPAWGKLYPNTWSFTKAQFARMIKTMPLHRVGSVSADSVKAASRYEDPWGAFEAIVMAGAADQLVSALTRGYRDKGARAIQSIVESCLPNIQMPKRRVRAPGMAAAWRWVVGTGTITLQVEAATLKHAWNGSNGAKQVVMVAAFLSQPGTGRRDTMVYRDGGDARSLEHVTREAIRSLKSQGYLR